MRSLNQCPAAPALMSGLLIDVLIGASSCSRDRGADPPVIDPNRETGRNQMVDEHIIPRDTVLMFFSALAVGAVPILRRREPDLPRPYRTPLYPFVTGFYLLVSTVIVGSALYERPVEGGLGIATILAGTPLYLLWRRL